VTAPAPGRTRSPVSTCTNAMDTTAGPDDIDRAWFNEGHLSSAHLCRDGESGFVVRARGVEEYAGRAAIGERGVSEYPREGQAGS